MRNEIITIEASHYNLKVHYKKTKRARLEWCAPGIEFYLDGSFKGALYEQAANIALNMCIDRNIPAIALKRARAVKLRGA